MEFNGIGSSALNDKFGISGFAVYAVCAVRPGHSLLRALSNKTLEERRNLRP